MSSRLPQSLYSSGSEPDPRFSLANERTFLAWVRTSLALLASGVALEALQVPVSPGFRLAAALVFVALGVLAAAQAPKKYDAAILVANVTGFAQEATLRIRWSTSLAAEIPWYATEVPTIFISTSLPNHLIDVPMVKTVIHAHAPTRETIRATVDKIQGLSEFQGTFNENVWCDTFGTRL